MLLCTSASHKWLTKQGLISWAECLCFWRASPLFNKIFFIFSRRHIWSRQITSPFQVSNPVGYYEHNLLLPKLELAVAAALPRVTEGRTNWNVSFWAGEVTRGCHPLIIRTLYALPPRAPHGWGARRIVFAAETFHLLSSLRKCFIFFC